MIKLICYVRRRSQMSRGDFHEYWLDRHGPLIRNTPELARHIIRYEQNHRTESDYARDGDAPTYDGATVQWFDSMDAFGDFFRDPAYADLIAPDEARFLDRSGFALLFAGQENVVIPPSDSVGAGVKLLCLIPRSPARSIDSFQAHWRDIHGPIFRDTPELSRHILGYLQHPRLASDYGRKSGPQYDGLTEQWFESEEGFWNFVREPRYREKVVPDEETLLIRKQVAFILCRPANVIIGD